MHDRFEKQIEEGLTRRAGRLDKAKKRPIRSPVERQIGRLLGRNSRVASLFRIQVHDTEREYGPGLKVTWTTDETGRQWAA